MFLSQCSWCMLNLDEWLRIPNFLCSTHICFMSWSTELRKNIKGYPWVYFGHLWGFKKTYFTKAYLGLRLGNLFVLRALIWCPVVCGLLLEQGFLSLIEKTRLMCKEGTEVTISLPSLSFNFEKPVIILHMVLCILEEFYNVLPILPSLTWLATWTSLWFHDSLSYMQKEIGAFVL